MKFIKVMLAIVSICSFSLAANAESGYVDGKITKIKHHQYLTNSGWDGHSWICLTDTKKIGSCATTSACNGGMQLVISKNAGPEMMSIVLAAQFAKKEVEILVDDTQKLAGEDACFAHAIAVSTP